MTTHDTEVLPIHHRRQISMRTLTVVLPILALLTLVSLATSLLVLTKQRQSETTRADRASVAVEELCEQVRAMGAVCVVDPEQFKGSPGERGLQGPPGEPGAVGIAGRPPTQAEIAGAVVAYLLTHPPPAGEPGPVGPQGPPGESAGSWCPGRLEVQTVRLANGGQSIRILACVTD